MFYINTISKNKKLKSVILLFPLIALFGALLSGCATMEPESIHKLKKQVKSLNKKTGKLSQSNAYLEEKLHGMQINIANQGVKISGLNAKLRDIYGKYEVESHDLHILQRNFRQYRLIVNKQLVQLFSLVHAKPSSETQTAVSANKTPAKKKIEFQSFKTGMGLYKNKEYSKAILSFNKFLERHPQSKYTPDALYYKGVSNFNLKKYPVAILEFHKFSELYPKDPHVSMAIYLQGMGFLKLSDPSDASILFRQVVSKYKGTKASGLSAKELQNLSK